ncbi:hypothetical protein TNCV_383371 [Trichonephila clavipes]|nr:hypothetical protein TNCV_383371 [Trichonephila clavipes]
MIPCHKSPVITFNQSVEPIYDILDCNKYSIQKKCFVLMCIHSSRGRKIPEEVFDRDKVADLNHRSTSHQLHRACLRRLRQKVNCTRASRGRG